MAEPIGITLKLSDLDTVQKLHEDRLVDALWSVYQNRGWDNTASNTIFDVAEALGVDFGAVLTQRGQDDSGS